MFLRPGKCDEEENHTENFAEDPLRCAMFPKKSTVGFAPCEMRGMRGTRLLFLYTRSLTQKRPYCLSAVPMEK